MLEWMGLNFYDYDGIQPKLSPPQTFQPAVYQAQKVQKYTLNSPLQALLILKNDDDVEN